MSLFAIRKGLFKGKKMQLNSDFREMALFLNPILHEHFAKKRLFSLKSLLLQVQIAMKLQKML
jgi:hypothetical protein